MKKQPAEFQAYLDYCRSLNFEEDPNYELARNFFADYLLREGFSPDETDFDWF